MIRRIFARGRSAEVKPDSNAPLNAVEVRPDEDSSTLVDGPSDDWIHEFDATIPPSPTVDRSPDEPVVMGLGDAPSLGALTSGDRGLRSATLRRVTGTVRRVHGWIRDADSEIVVLHTGPRPTDDRLELLRAALDRPVDRGGGSMGSGRNVRRAIEVPDIVVEDDGDNATLTKAWQTLARRGAHAVITGPPRPGQGSVVMLRRSSVDTSERPPKDTNRAHPSWWVSVAFTVMFACWEAMRLVTERSDLPRTTNEVAWIEAARAGTVDGIGDAPLPGSSMWPALTQPIYDWFGVSGLRWFALLCTVVSIGLAGVAASRLFGGGQDARRVHCSPSRSRSSG